MKSKENIFSYKVTNLEFSSYLHQQIDILNVANEKLSRNYMIQLTI